MEGFLGQAFFWTLERHHAEREREVPEQVKVLFDTFIDCLSSVFNEADLREAFQEVVDQVDQSVPDDVQLEFDF